MAVVVGIVLLGLGAVLVWGVDRSVGGGEIATIGVILMVSGGVGILASFLISPRATPGGRAVREPAWDSTSSWEPPTSAFETQPEEGSVPSDGRPPLRRSS